MFNLVNGLKLRNMRNNAELVVKAVNGDTVVIDENGNTAEIAKKRIYRWCKPIGMEIETARGPQMIRPVADNLMDAIYNNIIDYVEGLENTTCKRNNNGTTVLKVGKRNFSEIRVQKKKVVVRILQDATTDINFRTIPDTHGWVYKSELFVTDMNQVGKVCEELLISYDMKK